MIWIFSIKMTNKSREHRLWNTFNLRVRVNVKSSSTALQAFVSSWLTGKTLLCLESSLFSSCFVAGKKTSMRVLISTSLVFQIIRIIITLFVLGLTMAWKGKPGFGMNLFDLSITRVLSNQCFLWKGWYHLYPGLHPHQLMTFSLLSHILSQTKMTWYVMSTKHCELCIIPDMNSV